MSKFKGTKGRWYLQSYSDAYTNIIRCDNGKGNETLYLMSTSQSSNPEERYNAKLMASAPLLLDKLEHCVGIIKQLVELNLIPVQMFENVGNCLANSLDIMDESTSLNEVESERVF
jgi:hypothetical protein